MKYVIAKVIDSSETITDIMSKIMDIEQVGHYILINIEEGYIVLENKIKGVNEE